MTTLQLQLDPDGRAEITHCEAERVTLLSTVPSPPGSTLIGTLDADVPSYRVKVRSCKKQSDGRFLIDGKLVNLTRAQKERLVS